MQPYFGIATACLLAFAAGCKGGLGSGTQEIASADRVKTGMFTPEKHDTVSVGYASRAGAPLSAGDLVQRLGVGLKADDDQKLYVVPTFDGNQLLVVKQGVARPLPVGGVTKSGKPFFLSTALVVPEGAKGGMIGSKFYQLAQPDDPLVGTVTDAGNQSNMHVFLGVVNSLGQKEDYLTSYLNQLDTLGARPVRLVKIGNTIVERKTGETVLEFRELGNQVWRVYGVYNDRQLKHGSVIWSPDMRQFYSIRQTGAPIVHWRRQDDNSMDLEKTGVEGVNVPAIVKRLLAERITSDVKNLPRTGPLPGTIAARATSLAERRTALPALAKGFDLAHDYLPSDDRFYELPTGEGYSLGGEYPYSGTASYPVDAIVQFGNHDITGRVVSATDRSEVPGGWFSRDQVTKTTVVETQPGVFFELSSTNGGEVERRMLNAHDIRLMEAAANGVLASPEHAQQEQEFRAAIDASNAASADVIEGADAWENDYATVEGFTENIILPTATAGFGGDAASWVGGQAGAASAAGAEVFTAAAAKQITSSGISLGTTGAWAMATGNDDPLNSAGLGAGVSATAFPFLASSPYASGAKSGVKAILGGDGAYDAGVATLGGFGGALPIYGAAGIAPAVSVVGDAGGVGIDYMQMNQAADRVMQAEHEFYQPVTESNRYGSTLENMTPDVSSYASPSYDVPTYDVPSYDVPSNSAPVNVPSNNAPAYDPLPSSTMGSSIDSPQTSILDQGFGTP